MRGLAAMCLVLALLAFSAPAMAQAAEEKAEIGGMQIGLGVVGGANFPLNGANKQNYKITEAWGFYVDIPIVSTFHISPATTLYRLNHEAYTTSATGSATQKRVDYGKVGITDLTINFKFVIPLEGWKIFMAGLMGISNGRFAGDDPIQMHVGASLGFSATIVSNLEWVTLCQYKLIIDGDQSNLHLIQALGGLQFNF